MKKINSIQTKFIVISILSIFITLSAICGVIYYKVNNQTRTDYFESSNEQMKIVESSINMFYSQIDKDINMMTNDAKLMKADSTITTYKNISEKIQMTPSKNGGIEQEIYEVFDNYGKNHPGTLYAYLALEQNGGYIQ